MKIKIRKTKEEDCRRVAHVHRSSIKHVCGSFYSKKIISSWAGGSTTGGVRKSLKRKEINNIVAEVDGIIYGVGASVDNLIWICYVHPKWIGNGIGEKILNRLEKDIANKHFKEVKLNSTLNAFNFYLRNGYKRLKKKTLTFRDGTKVPCYEMSKRLKPVTI